MDTRAIPRGTLLMHVRNFTEDDKVLNQFKYPTWYFTKPTFFLYVQAKQPMINDGKFYVPSAKDLDIVQILLWRDMKLRFDLRTSNNIDKNSPLFTNLIIPLSDCYVKNLKVDIFQVTKDLPLLFLNLPDAKKSINQVTWLNNFIKQRDSSFVLEEPEENMEAVQWLFDQKDTPGLIIPKLSTDESTVDEVMLTAQSVPYLGFAGTVSVQRYLEYANNLLK